MLLFYLPCYSGRMGIVPLGFFLRGWLFMNLRKILFTCFMGVFFSSNMLWKLVAILSIYISRAFGRLPPDKWIPLIKCGKYSVVRAVIIVKNCVP